MTASPSGERVLILGGAGMVGVQVAREIARELAPNEIIISALTDREVQEAVAELTADAQELGWSVRFTGAAGDIFLPEALQGRRRADLLLDRETFDVLFDDIFSSDPEAYRRSMLHRMLQTHRPDVVVDCINTATAISYQDAYSASKRVKVLLDRAEEQESLAGESLGTMVAAVRELIIAQGVPQITRHILFLHRALNESSVRVYVKVGTTGTGGMGINIPYTHSEDRPSPTLLSKSAIGFAHTGLLFLLARTPGTTAESGASTPTMIKEVKPGAMIGFKRLVAAHVKLTGASGSREPGYLLNPRTLPIDGSINPLEDYDDYGRYEGRDLPVRMVGADTGENGFFSIGEFQAITYPRQMEYVTPEEVARTVVLEILGASTGRDVISAIDGAITEPSYRAGVLRNQAVREMERLSRILQTTDEDILPSIAVGHLGPPRLSKLLIEAYLIRAAAGSGDFSELLKHSPEDLQRRVEEYLQTHPRVVSLIVTIGIPLLRGSGDERTLTRGPRLNLPVSDPAQAEVRLDGAALERYAFMGWVDLRLENFAAWRARIERVATAPPDLARRGSAAFAVGAYMPDEFIAGDIVGWLLTNESDEIGMAGRRIL